MTSTPQANKDKMAAGHPLTDEDRAPWLLTLHGKIKEYVTAGNSMILACSALREQYRDTLRGHLPVKQVQFALLEADPKVIEAHLQARHHQFMNPGLLGSQLSTLEHPGDTAWNVSVAGSPQQSLEQLYDRLVTAGAVPVRQI